MQLSGFLPQVSNEHLPDLLLPVTQPLALLFKFSSFLGPGLRENFFSLYWVQRRQRAPFDQIFFTTHQGLSTTEN